MERVGIPVFESRVSPVLDTCTRVLIIDLEKKREIARREIYIDNISLAERFSIIKNLEVNCVICGGISDVFHNMLHGHRIGVIPGRAGAVEQVLQAYLCDRLDQPCFLMPGYKICV